MLKRSSFISDISKMSKGLDFLPLKKKNSSRENEKDNIKTDDLTHQTVTNLLVLSLDEIIFSKQKEFYQYYVDKTEFKEDDDDFLNQLNNNRKRIYHLAFETKECVKRTLLIYRKIEANVSFFDCDNLKFNGYRSALNVYNACIHRLLLIVQDINDKKKRINSAGILKDFESWSQLLEKLEILLTTVLNLQTASLNEFKKKNGETQSLKPQIFLNIENITEDSKIEENLFRLSSEHLVSFFGKTVGFQFVESLEKPLTGLVIGLASYTPKSSASLNSPSIKTNSILEKVNISQLKTTHQSVKRDSYIQKPKMGDLNGNRITKNNTIMKYPSIKATKSLLNLTKYFVDADSRAKKIAEVIKNANIKFCKDLWQLPESSVAVKGSQLVLEKTAINVVKEINLNNSLKLPNIYASKFKNSDEFVDIHPPCNIHVKDYVNVRILSHRLRKGMEKLDKWKTVESGPSSNNYDQSLLSNYPQLLGKSKWLILHAHGGGFIAQSSRAHEVYLRPWCNELQVPIVSIDYSLAPEHPFPRASEECFYIYAWCLLNKDALGWTGERIICVGDSAGGLLATNIVQRAIMNRVRVPDALVPIYAPFTLNYRFSPTRILSTLDPVVNLGILWRCLGAYCGIDDDAEAQNFKNLLKIKTEQNFTSNSISPGKNFVGRLLKTSKRFDISKSNDIQKDFIDEEKKNNFVQMNGLIKFHEFYGDSIFLIEKIKNHQLTNNPLMSPLLADKEDIAKFPRTCIISSTTDAFLDDGVEFLKFLKQSNSSHDMVVFKNLVHGFINLTNLNKDCRQATEKIANQILKNIFDDKPIDKNNFC